MSASVTMPLGTPTQLTSETIAKFEAGAARLRARLEDETGIDYFRHVATILGDHPAQTPGGAAGRTGLRDGAAAHLGEVTIELAPTELRSHTSEQLGALWREETGPVPEAVAIEFGTSILDPGEDVNVQLSGPDLERLRAAADRIKDRLGTYAGVYAIADSIRAGKAEMRLDIRPAAETLGLTLQDLARQVRQAFYGEEAQRIQRGRDDIRVMVRYPRDERRSVGDLENMRIRTPGGAEVPFSLVAQMEPGRGFASIRRVDRNRSVNVTASVDPQVSSASEVITDLDERILPEVLADFPGVFYSFEGAQAAQEGGRRRAADRLRPEPDHDLRPARNPAALLRAAVHHHGRHSVRALVGALWGHLLMSLDVTVMSMFGFVALTGVVVNDSLVMVDFINRERNRDGETGPRGERRAESKATARCRRPPGPRESAAPAATVSVPSCSPSLTTFAGLVPMMADRSMQAAFFIPMAVTLAFGVLFATLITLILVPVAYAILHDLQRLPQRLLTFVATAAPA